MQIWKSNSWLLVEIARTITVQSFVVVTSLVLELVGGQFHLSTNVSENTLGS